MWKLPVFSHHKFADECVVMPCSDAGQRIEYRFRQVVRVWLVRVAVDWRLRFERPVRSVVHFWTRHEERERHADWVQHAAALERLASSGDVPFPPLSSPRVVHPSATC